MTENNQKQKNKRKESVLYPIPTDRFKDDRSFVAIASSRQTARMTHSDSQHPAPAPPPLPCIVYFLYHMSWGRYAVYNSSKERTSIQSAVVSVSVGSSPPSAPSRAIQPNANAIPLAILIPHSPYSNTTSSAHGRCMAERARMDVDREAFIHAAVADTNMDSENVARRARRSKLASSRICGQVYDKWNRKKIR